MFLYKIEAEGEGFPRSLVIVIAEHEEGAFAAADQLLEKSAGRQVEATHLAIVEKKRLEKGNGYTIQL
jgi:hypothetical protein